MFTISSCGVEGIDHIRSITFTTWPVAYGEILSKEQLSYMLNLIYSEEALTNQIEKSRHQFILAREDGKVIGFASYSMKDATDPTVFRLHKLYVLPDKQKKGTGMKLLDYIIDEIKQQGASSIELNVNRNNKALHFYKRQGFQILREEDIDIGNGYFMNDYVMGCKLLAFSC